MRNIPKLAEYEYFWKRDLSGICHGKSFIRKPGVKTL